VKIITEDRNGAVERDATPAELLTLARAGDRQAMLEHLRMLATSPSWRQRLNGRMERGRG
jgi:hypothetical protein